MSKLEELKQKLKNLANVSHHECCPKCKDFISTLDELVKESSREFSEL